MKMNFQSDMTFEYVDFAGEYKDSIVLYYRVNRLMATLVTTLDFKRKQSLKLPYEELRKRVKREKHKRLVTL